MECWKCSLRYHYCSVHDLLCGFPTFLVFGEQSHLILYSRWQLSRYDTTIKQTKVILKKVIRLTIETGTLTGAWTPFLSSTHVTEHVRLSRYWDCLLFTSDFTRQPVLLPSPNGYHRKGLRQLDARPNQQPNATYLWRNATNDHLGSEIWYGTRQRRW